MKKFSFQPYHNLSPYLQPIGFYCYESQWFLQDEVGKDLYTEKKERSQGTLRSERKVF